MSEDEEKDLLYNQICTTMKSWKNHLEHCSLEDLKGLLSEVEEITGNISDKIWELE